MPEVHFQDWGLVDYQEAWDRQEAIFNETVRIKTENRTKIQESRPTTGNGQLVTDNGQQATDNYLVFCEHPHVYTLGKSGKENHLLLNQELLAQKGATFYKINRGGDITYHGPGQIVGYPILDLDHFFTDIHKYLRYLEEAIILTLADYGIAAGRVEGLTGVWIDGNDPRRARKICAMGVRCSRWVTMHGFAFNVNANLDYFNFIVPCGITDKAVTSLDKELGRKMDMEEVKSKVKGHLQNLFEFQFV